MKAINCLRISGLACAFGLCALPLEAQDATQVEKLNQQLKQMQNNFEKQQQQMKENFEKLLKEQQSQIELLKKEIDAAKTNSVLAQPSLNQPAAPQTPAIAWSPEQPLRIGSAQNYINLSFDGLVAAGYSTANDIERLQPGGHDPKQRGFTVQNLETVFDGKVDPYFRGQANVVLQIDPHGDTTIEAEEAYLETMSLPWNLQVKGGQFFTEFGRLNPTHPHAWDFVDQPLVMGRFFGEDGLRSAGTRVSWLAPTPFYSELFLTVANSQGGTAFSFRNEHESAAFLGRLSADRRVKSFSDMLLVPRYAASFNLSDSQTLVTGASAAFGPNSTGSDTDTQIYGVDLFWKWKSPNQHAGFPFVSFQNEAMMRRFKAGAFNWDLNANGSLDAGELPNIETGQPAFVPRETITDYGFYSQVAWGIRKGWVAALRGDYVFPETRAKYESILGRDPDRAERWRLSPNLTYYPSEFSKIRLQYNYDHRRGIGSDHSIWLQVEFLLGAHAAHKF
ncbi:MAG TPA: hypothetical protein VGE41_07910 [Verrucomicrobiae bacterium]